MTKWGALSGMIVGGLTVIIWITTDLSSYLYEMIPGFALSIMSVVIVSLLTKEVSKDIHDEFSQMENLLADIE